MRSRRSPTYLLRVAEPELIREAAAKHDAAIKDGLSCLLGGGDLLRLEGTEGIGPAWANMFNQFQDDLATVAAGLAGATGVTGAARRPMA